MNFRIVVWVTGLIVSFGNFMGPSLFESLQLEKVLGILVLSFSVAHYHLSNVCLFTQLALAFRNKGQSLSGLNNIQGGQRSLQSNVEITRCYYVCSNYFAWQRDKIDWCSLGCVGLSMLFAKLNFSVSPWPWIILDEERPKGSQITCRDQLNSSSLPFQHHLSPHPSSCLINSHVLSLKT